MTRKIHLKDPIKAISKKSYAKINLYLDIIGKRADGYHEIRTVYREIDLYDEMNFLLTKENNIKVWCNIDLGDPTQNTVYRIALLMKEKYRVKDGIEISVKKRVPVSAGLGGGSSNAATTILVLSQLWCLGLEEDEMHDLASKIGSDVNFFLVGGTAIGEGRGEIVRVIDPFEFGMILLVKPEFGISSAEAYQILSEYGTDVDLSEFIDKKDPTLCFNRLQGDLITKYPVLGEIISYMQENGALKAIVSGSGSTVIGLYDNRRIFDDHFIYYREKGFWCCQAKTKRR